MLNGDWTDSNTSEISNGFPQSSKHEDRKLQQLDYSSDKPDKKERSSKLKEKREKLSDEEKELRKQERKLGRKRVNCLSNPLMYI